MSLALIAIGLGARFSEVYIDQFPVEDRYLGGFNLQAQWDHLGKQWNYPEHKIFDQDEDNTKLLIIGDSFAWDFLNSGLESQAMSGFDMVTWSVNSI